jgi:prevent-host-death family protein
MPIDMAIGRIIMIIVSKGILKNKMLEYFRNVERTGEEIVVTDHRKPVLRVVPIKMRRSLKAVFAKYQGKAKYMRPVTEPETKEWGDLA